MDNLKLPNVELEVVPEPAVDNSIVAPPPKIEVMVNNSEDITPHEEVFKQNPEPEVPPPKKKRQASQKQLENLAKMRNRRAENRAKAKAEEAAKIPENATPIKSHTPQVQSAPSMPSMNSADGFLNFMDYMEKYKNLKDNWKKREIEKAKSYVSKQQNQPEEKTHVEPKKKPVSKPPSLITNHSSNNNTYNDYF